MCLRKQQQQQGQHLKEGKESETKLAGWNSATCKQSPSAQEAVLLANNTHVFGGCAFTCRLFLAGACMSHSFSPGISASSHLQLTQVSRCECGSDDKWSLEFCPVFFAPDFIVSQLKFFEKIWCIFPDNRLFLNERHLENSNVCFPTLIYFSLW